MTVDGRSRALLWPVALLLVYGLTFRRAVDSGAAAAAGAAEDCDRARTVDQLQRCVAADATNVPAMTDLAAAYAAGGRMRDAERLYRRALAVDPDDGDVHWRVADLLAREGEDAAARAERRAALRRMPGRPDPTGGVR